MAGLGIELAGDYAFLANGQLLKFGVYQDGQSAIVMVIYMTI